MMSSIKASVPGSMPSDNSQVSALLAPLPDDKSQPGSRLALKVLGPILIGHGVAHLECVAFQVVDSFRRFPGLLAFGSGDVDVLRLRAGINLVDAVKEHHLAFFRLVAF